MKTRVMIGCQYWMTLRVSYIVTIYRPSANRYALTYSTTAYILVYKSSMLLLIKVLPDTRKIQTKFFICRQIHEKPLQR